MSTEREQRPLVPPTLVTSGRTATIVLTALGLSLLAWGLRPIVGAVAPDAVWLHHKELSPGLLLAFIFFPGALIVTLTILCLNRVLLHGVAWCTAGAVANLGELVATGAVADYVQVGASRNSPGDMYLNVGFCLLVLGALKIVCDSRRRERARLTAGSR
jgi:hypothetical protein